MEGLKWGVKLGKLLKLGPNNKKNHAIAYILTEKHHLTSIQVKRKEKKILKSFSGPGFIILLIFIIFLDGFLLGYFAPQKQDKQQ